MTRRNIYRERGILVPAERIVLTASTNDDAEFAAALLRDRGALVHPGYLFDAEQPAVALSLITAPGEFAAGIARLVAALHDESPGDAA